MFWQVYLLIVLVGIMDFLLCRRVLPQVRYALRLLILLKLILPPSLATPASFTTHLVRPNRHAAHNQNESGADVRGAIARWNMLDTVSTALHLIAIIGFAVIAGWILGYIGKKEILRYREKNLEKRLEDQEKRVAAQDEEISKLKSKSCGENG